jgi:hypothetical protein
VDGGWALAAGEDVFVGRRQEHLYARVRVEVRVDGGVGGLEIRIDPRHALRLEVDGGRVRAVARAGALVTVLGEAPAGPEVTLELRAEPSSGHVFSTELGPDELVAALVGPDGSTELGRLDGRYVSTEVAGGMTGRMVGLVCARGGLRLRSFTYTGSDDPGAVLG